MYEQSLLLGKDCDIFIACAAVADFRPENYQSQKIKKETGSETLTLKLVKNPDIVSAISTLENAPFVLGFAAESQALEENAKAKLEKKSLSMIAANDISNNKIGFDSEENAVTLFYKNKKSGAIEKLPLKQTSKYQLARQLIDQIVTQL